jgi:hypothetical protein
MLQMYAYTGCAGVICHRAGRLTAGCNANSHAEQQALYKICQTTSVILLWLFCACAVHHMSRTCTHAVHAATASCASPANILVSMQRYSLDNSSSVERTGGYHCPAAAAAACTHCTHTHTAAAAAVWSAPEGTTAQQQQRQPARIAHTQQQQQQQQQCGAHERVPLPSSSSGSLHTSQTQTHSSSNFAPHPFNTGRRINRESRSDAEKAPYTVHMRQ